MSAGARGLTLVECAVGMAAAGVVTAASGALLLAGLRLARDATATVESRRQLQAAATVLAGELAAISADAGDLVAATDSSVTLRALRGFGVVCAVSPGQVVLDDSLLSLLRAIDPTRDSVRFYAQGNRLTAGDDHWAAAGVSWVGNGSCASGSRGTALTLSGATASVAQAHEGAPVRLFEHVQYRRYRDATGQVMLGVRSPGPAGWNATSPVAGPLQGSGGLVFQLLDSAGAVAPSPGAAALLIVTLRAAPPLPGRVGDSLTVAVSVRGAPR